MNASRLSFTESPERFTNSRNPFDTPRKLHRSIPMNGAAMNVTSPSTPASIAYIANICPEEAPRLLNTAISFFSCSTFSWDTMNR